MALEMNQRKHAPHWIGPVIFVLFCFIVTGALLYDALIQRNSLSILPNYTYTIDQSINNSVNYFDSSFYPHGPAPEDSAYVTDLTKNIKTTFHYSYKASSSTPLTYTYSSYATIRGTYGVPGSTEDNSNVWSKQFQLEAPSTKTATTDEITIDKSILIPFEKYRRVIESFRLGLALPVNTEMQIQLTVNVSGKTPDGKPFSDSRVSSVSAPLNVQIYQLAAKYDKKDSKEITPGSSETTTDWRAQAELIGAVALGLLGLLVLVLSLRKSTGRSAYQRQLQKIYRYHDGIIIRTSKEIRLSPNKTIVPVKSFDDILNLEEETKSPIIASEIGDTATHFMIADGDLVYLYVLGVEPTDRLTDDELRSIETAAEKGGASTHPQRKAITRRTSTRRSIK